MNELIDWYVQGVFGESDAVGGWPVVHFVGACVVTFVGWLTAAGATGDVRSAREPETVKKEARLALALWFGAPVAGALWPLGAAAVVLGFMAYGPYWLVRKALTGR